MMEIAKIAEQIRINTHGLFYKTGIRGSCSTNEHQAFFRNMCDRMKEPENGDMVIEVSTFYQKRRAIDTVGFLEDIKMEPIICPEWDEAVDGPHPKEKFWHLITLDGRPYSWHNANFIAVPGQLSEIKSFVVTESDRDVIEKLSMAMAIYDEKYRPTDYLTITRDLVGR